MRMFNYVFGLAIAATLLCSAASAQTAIPDLSGLWQRSEGGDGRIFHPPATGPGPIVRAADAGNLNIGDHTNPILTPKAAAAVKAFGDRGRSGIVELPAWSLCWPSGVPLVLNMAEPVQFLQTADQITIIYRRDMQVRRIDLNKKHPENLKPSWYGYSVGHYEGNTLVVETRGQNSKALVDRFGTPRSENLRVIERYTVSPDRKALHVAFTVEDPEMFTTKWGAQITYQVAFEEFGERICAENNKNPDGGEFPVPADDSPDF